MTPSKRPEPLTDAVDAILSPSLLSDREAARGEPGDETVCEEATLLAAAFSELRAAYDGVDAPFAFDPRTSDCSRRRLTLHDWRIAGALLAAAATVVFVFLPKASDDAPRPRTQREVIEQESATRVVSSRSDRLPLTRWLGVLDVRTPRLAIARSVPSAADDLAGDVGTRRAGGSTVRFTRIPAARLMTAAFMDAVPSSCVKPPSLILKPRRKSHDDNANDDLDRGGSSDRKSVGPERLG